MFNFYPLVRANMGTEMSEGGMVRGQRGYGWLTPFVRPVF